MHSPALQETIALPPAEPLIVNKNLMLTFYAIIPLALAVLIVDLALLDGALKSTMPMNPDDWVWWTVIFGMPHIVASLLTVSDREYLAHYKLKLGLPLIGFTIVCLAVPAVAGMSTLSVIIAVYTIYHLIAQQYGISNMLLKRRPDAMMTTLRWLSVIASVLMYVLAYVPQMFKEPERAASTADALMIAIALVISASILVGYKISRNSRGQNNAHGHWHLWLNIAMLPACFLCASYEYAVLLIIIPRVVHDLTAFVCYSTHDHNRQAVRPDKFVYRIFSFTGLPVVVLCPLISVGVAFIAFQNKSEITMFFINVISFMHYYMESIIWKRDSLHRHYLKFS